MRRYRCPCCRQPLSKRKRRELSPLQWEKLQAASWMRAWEIAREALRLTQREFLQYQHKIAAHTPRQ